MMHNCVFLLMVLGCPTIKSQDVVTDNIAMESYAVSSRIKLQDKMPYQWKQYQNPYTYQQRPASNQTLIITARPGVTGVYQGPGTSFQVGSTINFQHPPKDVIYGSRKKVQTTHRKHNKYEMLPSPKKQVYQPTESWYPYTATTTATTGYRDKELQKISSYVSSMTTYGKTLPENYRNYYSPTQATKLYIYHPSHYPHYNNVNRYGQQATKTEKSDGIFGRLLSAVATILPLGLLLAALPANIMSMGAGKRSSDIDVPLVSMLQELKVLGSIDCQKRVLCEIGMWGATQEGSKTVKILARLATILRGTEYLGPLLDGLHSRQCSHYVCTRSRK